MTRSIDTRRDDSVVPPRPELGGGAATPSFRLPAGAASGLPTTPRPLSIRGRSFDWGGRTFVMGILNVTPDSFSGDGILEGSGDPVSVGLATAQSMVEEGADVLDVGGESTRPGHTSISIAEEIDRTAPVIAAIRAALPETPIAIDTTKAQVAEAALDAGADLINDVWGVRAEEDLLALAASRGVPIVLMHNRDEPRYLNLMPEIVADLQAATERAVDRGIDWDSIVLDPGFGFGKTLEHNLVLLRELSTLRILDRPLLLGASRKSTLGRILDLPADERIEATVATTVLGIAAGVDMVRVHDVRPNVRAARVTDAIVRRRGEPAEAG